MAGMNALSVCNARISCAVALSGAFRRVRPPPPGDTADGQSGQFWLLYGYFARTVWDGTASDAKGRKRNHAWTAEIDQTIENTG